MLAVLIAGLIQDEAEAFYQKVEKALQETKSLRFSYRITVEVKVGEEKDQGDITGDVAMRSDDRLRLWVSGSYLGEEIKGAVVCNGVTRRVRTDHTIIDTACPKKLSSEFGTLLARGGVFSSFASGLRHIQTVGTGWKLSDWRLLPEEKVETRPCKGVRFALESDVKKEQFVVKLWADPETSLPLKRVVRGGDDRIEITITEAWNDVKRDVEVPDEEFEFDK